MAKYECPVCGRPSEKPEGCFLHKPRKPLPRVSKFRLSRETPAQEKERKRKEREEMHQLFVRIWNKQGPVKKCWACGERIYGEILSIYFDHLLEKELYPELRLEEENIYFCCLTCHDNKSNGHTHPNHLKAIEEAREKFL